MDCILGKENIQAALAECKESGNFKTEKFFKTSGITKLKPNELITIFEKLDNNGDKSLDKDDIATILQKFQPGFRLLDKQEICDFLTAGDPDQDGEIGVEEFQAMVSKFAK